MRLFDYIHQGGAIMYILLLLNVFGIALMSMKFLVLRNAKQTFKVTADELASNIKKSSTDKGVEAIVEFSKHEISVHMGKMEKGLNTIKIIASISPLLGLLGTVIGVLVAFKVMSKTGLANPSSFAEGISMALITTVGGLIVAIPHYIGHNYLLGLVDDLEVNMEKEIMNKVL